MTRIIVITMEATRWADITMITVEDMEAEIAEAAVVETVVVEAETVAAAVVGAAIKERLSPAPPQPYPRTT
jgi:hypothetical protein